MTVHRLIRYTAVVLFLCVLGMLALPAQAATVTANWTNPTTNTDGSAIPATGDGSLNSWRIEYGTCNGTAFGTKVGEVVRTKATFTSPAITSATFNLNPGTSCLRVSVANTYGRESAPSNVATRVIDPPTPSPPLLVEAVVAGMNFAPVYRLTAAGDRDKRYSDACGFIEVGKECSGKVAYRFRQFSLYRVTSTEVKPYGDVTCGEYAVAPCG